MGKIKQLKVNGNFKIEYNKISLFGMHPSKISIAPMCVILMVVAIFYTVEHYTSSK